MATVLVRAYGLKDTGKSVNANLSNIDPSHRNNVKILFQHEITNQTGDFRPRQNVTRGQFATFLYRVMDNEEVVDESKEKPREDVADDIIVYNEDELRNALGYESTYKIVKLGKNIDLTDTITVKNKGVQIKGYSNGMSYSTIGTHGKTVFEVDTDNVHFDQMRIISKDSTTIHVISGELFKFTGGSISSNDNTSSGIIVEDNYKPIDDDGNFVRKETAIIKDSIIDVPQIGISFTGGLLYLENNTIKNALTGLKFTAVEVPQSVKGNKFSNNYEDIYIDWLPGIEKFLSLNHFDDGKAKINIDSDTIVVHNERELANALDANSSYKIVELGEPIHLTDTITVKNEGVLLKGTHSDRIYSVVGASGKTVFKIDANDVHFDRIRIFPNNSIGIHAIYGETFQFTGGSVFAEDNLSSGIIVEDIYKPVDDEGNWSDIDKYTAVIKDSFIFVPNIGVSFAGGRLIFENNLIDSANIGLKFTAVESPRNIENNIFFMNQTDIVTDYLPHLEKFFHLNHFDYGYPTIRILQ